jgi:hypothetical protein
VCVCVCVCMYVVGVWGHVSACACLPSYAETQLLLAAPGLVRVLEPAGMKEMTYTLVWDGSCL